MNSEAVVLPIVLLVALAGFAFWIWTLVDCLRRPDQQWQTAGQNKILWAVLIAVLGVLGSILYVVIPRPALRRVSA